MALDDLAASIKTIRDDAAAATRRATRTMDEIDNDPTLTDEGKKQAHAGNRDWITTHLKTLRDKETQLMRDEINTLDRKLDGVVGYSSSDIIAFRDAQDRAEAITTADDAARILNRATRTGDRTLEHAILRRAIDAGWPTIIATIRKTHPDIAQAASDRDAINASLTGDKSIRRALFYASPYSGLAR